MGGAHTNRMMAYDAVKKTILSTYKSLEKLKAKDLVKNRMNKYIAMGVYH